MQTHDNYNLRDYNTLSVDSVCSRFTTIRTLSDLEALPSSLKISEVLVLGEGSNVLLTRNLPKLVVHLKPRSYITQVDKLVVAWAGTRWHDLVTWAVERNLGGIENLALIPGLVGAAPIQNIGAYGSELSDVLVWVEAYNWQTGIYHRFSHAECHFAYRESIFKHYDKPFIITRVALDLRSDRPFNLSYAPLKTYFSMTDEKPSYKRIADAVSEIRRSKLPDPKELPNAGSFFKNPIISRSQYDKLKRKFTDLPMFPAQQDDHVKTSAAWLLEHCGYKGARDGDAGFSKRHALVLVNYGEASGQQLLQFSTQAKRAVKQKFGITLKEEVRII
ncbi:UDP-N-acetylmuramate dehydrogenase [Marinicella sp. W31]|uniref:UDP-N-acetylmuramate dehydrogenase n=1 Tax=Marinicella sp. W31 TaxID=3023713 RepID=UPI003756C866